MSGDGLIEHNAHVMETRAVLFEKYAYDHRMTAFGEVSGELRAVANKHAGGLVVYSFVPELELRHGVDRGVDADLGTRTATSVDRIETVPAALGRLLLVRRHQQPSTTAEALDDDGHSLSKRSGDTLNEESTSWHRRSCHRPRLGLGWPLLTEHAFMNETRHDQAHSGHRTEILEVRGVQWASEKARVEAVLGRRPGVIAGRGQPGRPDRDRDLRLGSNVDQRICVTGSETAATTATGARSPRTSVIPWPRTGGPGACRWSGRAARSRGARPDALPARGHGPRRPRRHVDGRHGPRHAQPVRRRRRLLGADPAVVADRPRRVRLRRRGTVRAARRRVVAAAQPAGDLLLVLDLLHRGRRGVAGAHARHDGPGRRRRRRRMARTRSA